MFRNPAAWFGSVLSTTTRYVIVIVSAAALSVSPLTMVPKLNVTVPPLFVTVVFAGELPKVGKPLAKDSAEDVVTDVISTNAKPASSVSTSCAR